MGRKSSKTGHKLETSSEHTCSTPYHESPKERPGIVVDKQKVDTGKQLSMDQMEQMIKEMANKEVNRRMSEIMDKLEEQDTCIRVLKEEVTGLNDQNKALQNENSKLKQNVVKTIRNHSQSIVKLKEEIRNLKTDRRMLRHNHSIFSESIQSIEEQCHATNIKSEKIETSIDDIQQDLLKRNLKIIGINEDDENDDAESISKLVKELNVEMDKSEILQTYRLGKNKSGGKPRDLVVEFKNLKLREEIYKKRRGLIHKNIYVNEHLTAIRSKLYFETRQLRKKKIIHSTWTQNGNVLIQMNESSPPVHILNQNSLSKIEGL